MERQIITNLNAFEYQHPFDRKALELLKQTSGFKKIMETISEYGIETYYRIKFTGSGLRVSESNFPAIHAALVEACAVLDMKDCPELYLINGGIASYTIGVKKPFIVLSTFIIENFTPEELSFILGHQLSYIKSESVLYQQMAEVISGVAQIGFGIGQVITMPIKMALGNWRKMAAFTADRAGLLCCQDLDAAASVLIKLAGQPMNMYHKIDIDEFKRQAYEFEEFDLNTYHKIVKMLLSMEETHPPYVIRAAQFFKWLKSGEFEKILNREAVIHQLATHKCSFCGKKTLGDEIFCTFCGNKVGAAPTGCRNCGKTVSENDAFCMHCGTGQ